MEKLYGSIEAGGTKCICAVGSSPSTLRDIVTIPTTVPEETLQRIGDYFVAMMERSPIESIGISCFGPIDMDKRSATYGYITTTPKPHWSNTDVVGTLSKRIGVPLYFETDVNGAALAEGMWGSAVGLDTFIYITVGTGVGLGIVANGRPVHGLVHPEGGHIVLPLHPDDPIEGVCPYHRGCLEGLTCGTAIEKRCNKRGAAIDDADAVWDLVAHYLGVALANFICTLSPQKIILGGGIMKREFLFPRIRRKVLESLNGYVASELVKNHIEDYIVPPALTHCGVLGGICLALVGASPHTPTG